MIDRVFRPSRHRLGRLEEEKLIYREDPVGTARVSEVGGEGWEENPPRRVLIIFLLVIGENGIPSPIAYLYGCGLYAGLLADEALHANNLPRSKPINAALINKKRK
jgi:hypothetical protein